MAAIRFVERTKKYYIRWRELDGTQCERSAGKDKRVAEQLKRKIETELDAKRNGLVDPRAARFGEMAAIPLGDHVETWRDALLSKGNVAKHANHHKARVLIMLAIMEADRLSDLSPSKIQAALKSLVNQGLSLRTVNHYRAALKNFTRWMVRDARMRDDPSIAVSGYNADAKRAYVRRAFAPDELAKLIASAERGRPFRGMSGPTRAMAYRVAASTGLRVNELRSLVPKSFRLDSNPPTVVVRPGYCKNRQEAVQPIPKALADLLRTWLEGKPDNVAVFPITDRSAKMVQKDLKAAGINPADSEGRRLDFHSLRGFYASALLEGGASVKTTQTLMRHSTPLLTLNLYARLDPADAARAVESIAVSKSHRDAITADPSHNLTTSGDVSSRTDSDLDACSPMRETLELMKDPKRNLLDSNDLPQADALGRMTGAHGNRTHPRAVASPRDGFEDRRQPLANQGKHLAECVEAPDHPTISPHDPDLALIVEAWQDLAPALKAGIVAMVKAACAE